MGFWLHVELDCDKELLPDFTRWCCKAMLYALAHAYEICDGDPSVLDMVADKLDIDIGPLHKVSGGDMSLFLEGVDSNDKRAWARAEQERLEYEHKHESNWQSPSTLGACIRELTQASDSNPGVFGELGVLEYIDGEYYQSGESRQDLDDLHRIVSWAEANDVPRIRLLLVQDSIRDTEVPPNAGCSGRGFVALHCSTIWLREVSLIESQPRIVAARLRHTVTPSDAPVTRCLDPDSICQGQFIGQPVLSFESCLIGRTHHNRYPTPEWVRQQVYLHTYPKELMRHNQV